MSQNGNAVRRRKWKRYRLNAGGIVLVKKQRMMDFGPPKMLPLGPVVNIGLGGLWVQYIANRQRAAESEALTISLPDLGEKVEPIPFRIVTDNEVARLPDGKVVRNRHVQFGTLTDYQTFQIKTLIREFASDIDLDRRSGSERRRRKDPRFEDEAFQRVNERRFGGDRRSLL